jgi:hypothetical protein
MHFVHLSSRVDSDRAARKHGAVATPQLVAIEFTVADLTPCLYLFGTILGLEMAPIARHPTLDADVAQVDAGGVVINLLCPTDTGSGTPLGNPEPRLSQLNFVLQLTGELAELRSRCETAGAAVVERDDTLFYIDSHMTTGLLGAETTLVFSSEETPEAGRDG